MVELTEQCEPLREPGFCPPVLALTQGDQPEIVQRPRDAPGVANAPPQRQALFLVLHRPFVLSAPAGHEAEEVEREPGQPILAKLPADGDRLIAHLRAV